MDRHIKIRIELAGIRYEGLATPSDQKDKSGFPTSFSISLANKWIGHFFCGKDGWYTETQGVSKELVKEIGEYLTAWWE